jgi:hypothetical protein
MMSATPIFEQLCREIHDASNAAWPVDGAQPMIASQRKGPAHALEETSRGLGYERVSYEPHALAGWARPTS